MPILKEEKYAPDKKRKQTQWKSVQCKPRLESFRLVYSKTTSNLFFFGPRTTALYWDTAVKKRNISIFIEIPEMEMHSYYQLKNTLPDTIFNKKWLHLKMSNH